MAEGKRYRSTKRRVKVWLGSGRYIEFINHLYPQSRQPKLTDAALIEKIEAHHAFGKGFVEAVDIDEIKVKASAAKDETEREALERAAKALARRGLNINPKILEKKQEEADAEESGEEKAEEPQLPAKTLVRQMKKDELLALIEEHGWDIDTDQNVDQIKKAIIATIDDSSS